MPPEEELQALDNILDVILRGIQEALEAGEILSPELQMMLAEEIRAITSRIDQLQRENPPVPPAPPEEPPIEPGMDSSNVNSFGYDPENQRLLVKFNGRDQRD